MHLPDWCQRFFLYLLNKAESKLETRLSPFSSVQSFLHLAKEKYLKRNVLIPFSKNFHSLTLFNTKHDERATTLPFKPAWHFLCLGFWRLARPSARPVAFLMRAFLELVVTERSYLYGVPFTHSSRVGLLQLCTPRAPFPSRSRPRRRACLRPSFLLSRGKRFFGSFSARWRVPEECSGSRVPWLYASRTSEEPPWNRNWTITGRFHSDQASFCTKTTHVALDRLIARRRLYRHVWWFNRRCVTMSSSSSKFRVRREVSKIMILRC